jgi:IS30 family transposase
MNQKRNPLTLWDRQIIVAMHEQGSAVREIGRYLKRDASIISRELRRNRRLARLRLSPMERAQWADNQAKARLGARKRGKRCSIKLPQVRGHIVDKIISKVSPEAIAATMEAEIWQKVSCATIYRWIKKEAPELKPYLYEKGKKRRQRVIDAYCPYQKGTNER